MLSVRVRLSLLLLVRAVLDLVAEVPHLPGPRWPREGSVDSFVCNGNFTNIKQTLVVEKNTES